jgi:hypothetical protein
MINVYPVDDFYNSMMNKKFNDEALNEYESKRFQELEDNFQTKAINDVAIIKNLEAEKNAIADAISLLEKKMFKIESRISSLTTELIDKFDYFEVKKIKTPFYNIGTALNAPATDIFDEKIIPMEYIKQSVVQRIDKAQILKDLKQGMIIPGAQLQQRKRLVIDCSNIDLEP